MKLINEKKLNDAHEGRLRKCNGATIVALYSDDKPESYLNLINRIFDQFPTQTPDWLTKYEIKNIHATIVGLEGQSTGEGRVIHDNLFARFGGLLDRKDLPGINFQGILNFFKQMSWPIRIQVGGFSPNDTNPYDPQRSPFQRAFDIQDNGLIVMMGWPIAVDLKSFLPTLLGIRKYLECFNAVHKYHVRPQQQDNDLFFVLGSLDFEKWQQRETEERNKIEQELIELRTKVRELLAKEPQIIEVSLQDIWVLQYFFTTLKEVGLHKRLVEANDVELQSIYT